MNTRTLRGWAQVRNWTNLDNLQGLVYEVARLLVTHGGWHDPALLRFLDAARVGPVHRSVVAPECVAVTLRSAANCFSVLRAQRGAATEASRSAQRSDAPERWAGVVLGRVQDQFPDAVEDLCARWIVRDLAPELDPDSPAFVAAVETYRLHPESAATRAFLEELTCRNPST